MIFGVEMVPILTIFKPPISPDQHKKMTAHYPSVRGKYGQPRCGLSEDMVREKGPLFDFWDIFGGNLARNFGFRYPWAGSVSGQPVSRSRHEGAVYMQYVSIRQTLVCPIDVWTIFVILPVFVDYFYYYAYTCKVHAYLYMEYI